MNFPFKPSSQIPDGSASVNSALFNFGHGLSYTTFEYSNLKINPRVQTMKVIVSITCDVKNVGERVGDEVVQLYIRDLVSYVNTYELNLRGFERINLQPGEAKTVKFTLNPEDLKLYNQNHKLVVEPGQFVVKIGSSSNDIRLEGKFVVAEDDEFEEAQKELEREIQIARYVHPSVSKKHKNLLFDSILESKWDHYGSGAYIDFELKEGAIPDEISIAWHNGDSRKYEFEILLSCGGGQFIPVFKGQSSGTTNNLEKYTFKGCTASDMRIVFFGNSVNQWTSVTEIELPSIRK